MFFLHGKGPGSPIFKRVHESGRFRGVFFVKGRNPSRRFGKHRFNPLRTPNATIALTFGFEANDDLLDSVGTFYNLQINYAAVPEPATLFLLGIGLIGFAGAGRKTIFTKS